MSVECRIYFPTSFRKISMPMFENAPNYFHTEGFCELYGAVDFMYSMKEIVGVPVSFYIENQLILKDPYENQLFAYPLKTILELLQNNSMGYYIGSRKVCITILKSVLENVEQEEPMGMLYFH